MKQKILVIGFPHCGTSILKCKLGECKNTVDFPTESPLVPLQFEKACICDNIIVKNPFVPQEMFNADFILKNTSSVSYTHLRAHET